MRKANDNLPGWVHRLLTKILNHEDVEEITGDLQELFNWRVGYMGSLKARLLLVYELVLLFFKAHKPRKKNPLSTINYFDMDIIFQRIKTTFRSKKSFGYFSLKLLILVLGLTVFLTTTAYINHEKQYDAHHTNANRIYRLILTLKSSTGEPVVPLPLLPRMLREIPEIGSGFRLLRPQVDAGIKIGNENFLEPDFFFAEKEIFKVLDFKFLRGSKEKALDSPNDVVISQSVARKYFGDADPMGQIIRYVKLNGELVDLEVSAVIADAPSTSHFHPGLMVNYNSDHNPWFKGMMSKNWNFGLAWSYIMTTADINESEFVQQLNDHYIKTLPFYEQSNNANIRLQKLTDIHLSSQFKNEIEIGGNEQFIIILGIISYFMLLVACLNYLVLTTADNLEKAKSMAIMRIFGANKSHMFSQYFTQSIFQMAIASFISVLIIILIIPYLNISLGSNISLDLLTSGQLLSISVGLLIYSVLIGLHPVVILSGAKISLILKGRAGNMSKAPNNRFSIKRLLVAVQLIFAIFSLFTVLVISEQMKFINSKDLGFDKSSVLVISSRRGLSENTFRTELLRNPNIAAVTSGARVPGGRPIRTKVFRASHMTANDRIEMLSLAVDPYFMDLFKIEVIKGRKFNSEAGSDSKEAVIINEKAANMFSFEGDILDQSIEFYDNADGSSLGSKKIIGVVKDLNFESLHEESKPKIFSLKDIGGSRIMVKLSPNDLAGTVKFIESKWSQQVPDLPMEYYFLDESFQAKYSSEQRLEKLIWPITIIAIFASALGLLSLIAFSVQLMEKEISIRKVLGASGRNLYLMVAKNYLLTSLIAILLTLPAARFIMAEWLNNFAYHVELGASKYLVVSIIILVVVLAAISYHTIKTVLINPAPILRQD